MRFPLQMWETWASVFCCGSMKLQYADISELCLRKSNLVVFNLRLKPKPSASTAEWLITCLSKNCFARYHTVFSLKRSCTQDFLSRNYFPLIRNAYISNQANVKSTFQTFSLEICLLHIVKLSITPPDDCVRVKRKTWSPVISGVIY